jgi:hypothetical protein
MAHLLNDQELLGEARESIRSAGPSQKRLNLLKIETIPTLQSLYAEALRFGVQIHIPRSAPHHSISIDGYKIPENKMIIVNTWLAHTKDPVWNTQHGKHPTNQFWARRFLVDPRDSFTGPCKNFDQNRKAEGEKDGVRFSVDGLEGAWIPYGGKQVCIYPTGVHEADMREL